MELAGKTKKQKAESDVGSVVSGSDNSGTKKERKKAAPKTEEEKAAINAKRAATREKNKAAAGSSDEAAAPVEVAPVVAAPVVAAPVAAAAGKAGAKPKTAKPKAVTYTKEQLSEFEPTTIDGSEYGVNVRGDMVNGDGEYAGHWDSSKKKRNGKATKPADWEEITAE